MTSVPVYRLLEEDGDDGTWDSFITQFRNLCINKVILENNYKTMLANNEDLKNRFYKEEAVKDGKRGTLLHCGIPGGLFSILVNNGEQDVLLESTSKKSFFPKKKLPPFLKDKSFNRQTLKRQGFNNQVYNNQAFNNRVSNNQVIRGKKYNYHHR